MAVNTYIVNSEYSSLVGTTIAFVVYVLCVAVFTQLPAALARAGAEADERRTMKQAAAAVAAAEAAAAAVVDEAARLMAEEAARLMAYEEEQIAAAAAAELKAADEDRIAAAAAAAELKAADEDRIAAAGAAAEEEAVRARERKTAAAVLESQVWIDTWRATSTTITTTSASTSDEFSGYTFDEDAELRRLRKLLRDSTEFTETLSAFKTPSGGGNSGGSSFSADTDAKLALLTGGLDGKGKGRTEKGVSGVFFLLLLFMFAVYLAAVTQSSV